MQVDTRINLLTIQVILLRKLLLLLLKKLYVMGLFWLIFFL